MPDADNSSFLVKLLHSRFTTEIRQARYTARRVHSLDRNNTRLIQQARQVNADITYLGIAPLPGRMRARSGHLPDWEISPLSASANTVIPRREKKTLSRLASAGIAFPLLYIAHEAHESELTLLTGATDYMGQGPLELDTAAAGVRRALSETPASDDSVTLTQDVGRRANVFLNLLDKALQATGVFDPISPVIARNIAVALAAGLSPVILGVIPAGRPSPGRPAAWYIIARREWEPIFDLGQNRYLNLLGGIGFQP
jgi:hypothetical protein